MKIASSVEMLLRRRNALQRKILSYSSLHVGQPDMLRYICEHPGCSQKQMADHARVTPASIAASFKRLERNGLIMRRADTADTRCNRVYITKAGERELDYCLEKLNKLDDVLTEGIGKEELQCFEKVIQKMLDNLDREIRK